MTKRIIPCLDTTFDEQGKAVVVKGIELEERDQEFVVIIRRVRVRGIRRRSSLMCLYRVHKMKDKKEGGKK